jgi:hypothetical protein
MAGGGRTAGSATSGSASDGGSFRACCGTNRCCHELPLTARVHGRLDHRSTACQIKRMVFHANAIAPGRKVFSAMMSRHFALIFLKTGIGGITSQSDCRPARDRPAPRAIAFGICKIRTPWLTFGGGGGGASSAPRIGSLGLRSRAQPKTPTAPSGTANRSPGSQALSPAPAAAWCKIPLDISSYSCHIS